MKIGRRGALLAAGVGIVGGVVATARPATAAGTTPNGTFAGESADVVALRDALNKAAANSTTLPLDNSGRRIVTAKKVTHLLKAPLVIGGNTALVADGATFQTDYPLVDATYTADRVNWHSPTPTYTDTFVAKRVADGTADCLLINWIPDSTISEYRAPGNIRVQGGTWEASAYYLRNETGDEYLRGTKAPPMNTLVFSHTHDVEVVGATIRNVKWWHGIELNAVRTATVANCRFEGWIEAPTGGVWNGDAIQIDIPSTTGGWGGVVDNTPCIDVRLRNNYVGPSTQRDSFGKFGPSHSAVTGSTYKNVWVEGNTIEETKWTGILAENTSNVVIRENKLINCRGGIYVKGSKDNALQTVDIVSNDITPIPAETGLPTLMIKGYSATSPISDAAVYANRYSGGTITYTNVSFRRPPQS